MLRTPEPLGSSSGAVSFLLGTPVLFSFPQVPRAPISGPCSHSPSSSCCCLILPEAHTPEKSSPGPSANHTPGIFTDHGIGRLRRPRESSPTPFNKRGQPGPAAMGLAQGNSAGWQQSWDMNSRLLRTLDNSDDAQMSMKGLNLWARLKSKDLRPLPGSWLHVPFQSGTRRKGTLALSASTPNFLLAMFAHHQLQCAAILQDLSTFLSCVSGSERCKIHTTVSPKLKGRTSEPRVHKHQLHWPQGLGGVLNRRAGKKDLPRERTFQPIAEYLSLFT